MSLRVPGVRCLKNERLCINGRERFRLPLKTEGGEAWETEGGNGTPP